ncbi:MAG: hypothetical protein F6J94_03865 [Moorea sp. SIO1F2]|nr:MULTISPECIES: hypothetical protein [unclassified Moorena]NEO22880.1 hypothetical protein [Moorena sp. SIO4A5]NEQ56664.1 hypothetical protein [Moorena sp. SIO4A1]NET81121.1 hypothetical protein [Moorena sp. SIO1F2]
MLEVLVDWEIGRSGDRESDQQLHEDCGGIAEVRSQKSEVRSQTLALT